MNEPGGGSSGAAGLVATLQGAGVPVGQIKQMITGLVGERPEAAVAGAFVGGLIVARIFRRLGS